MSLGLVEVVKIVPVEMISIIRGHLSCPLRAADRELSTSYNVDLLDTLTFSDENLSSETLLHL